MKNMMIAAVISGAMLAACSNAANDDAMNGTATVAPGETMDPAAGVATADTALTADEQAFLEKAIKADNAEVQAGQMAAQQGGTAAVRDYGTMLAAEHGAHKDKLATLASQAGVPVSDEPTPEGKATADKLRPLSGANFDAAFKQAMIADHQKNIAEYQKHTSSPNGALSALAQETVPVLQKHLEAAQAL